MEQKPNNRELMHTFEKKGVKSQDFTGTTKATYVRTYVHK